MLSENVSVPNEDSCLPFVTDFVSDFAADFATDLVECLLLCLEAYLTESYSGFLLFSFSSNNKVSCFSSSLIL